MCITDNTTGTGERRARTKSLKQHHGGMQGPELACATENNTIFWEAFLPTVINSCPYSHGECHCFFFLKASSSISFLTAVLTC